MAGNCCWARWRGASTRERVFADRRGLWLLCRSAPCARCVCCIPRQERSSACGSRVTFSLRGQRESNQRERPPHLALAGHPARQVREGRPGFSTGHRATAPCVASTPASMPSPALAKRHRHPCRCPLRGLSSAPHRRTGAPGRAADHPGPHSSEQPGQKRRACCFRFRRGRSSLAGDAPLSLLTPPHSLLATMTPESIMELGQHALYVAMLVAAPLLLTALAVGLLIGVIQAATQINEMTLSFIPKLIAMALVALVAGPWMLRLLVQFTTQLIESLPGAIR